MADLGLGGMLGGFTDILIGIGKALFIGVVILFWGGILIAGWFMLQRRKHFNIPVTIYILTSDKGLMVDHDKGALSKMLAGGEELKLKYNKVSLNVPPPECWIPNLRKGGASLEFIKVGRIDYHPLTRSFKDKKGANKESIIKKIKDLYKSNYPDEELPKAYWESIDVRSKLKDVEIKPVPSDIKSHLFLESDENVIKHHKINKVKEFIPFITIALTLAFLVFAIIWYFKYADVLVNRSLDVSERVAKSIENINSNKVVQNIEVPPEGGEPPPI
ncbi:hypothetical protein KJ660_04235 [Candidatus Micrarchaeota archaeon]|nr:hypothetical protein [Candidatus Micrarchaeota archaeon]